MVELYESRIVTIESSTMHNLSPGAVTRREKLSFESWMNSKPQPPKATKPVKKCISMPPGIALSLIGVCSLLGVAIMSIGITFWNMSGVMAFLILFSATLGVSVVLPITVVEIGDKIYGARYRQAMQDTGWAEHLIAVKNWKQEGRTKFLDLAARDFPTELSLKLLDFD